MLWIRGWRKCGGSEPFRPRSEPSRTTRSSRQVARYWIFLFAGVARTLPSSPAEIETIGSSELLPRRCHICMFESKLAADFSMADSDARPRVSVIIATYNRSNVLYYAIESVRRQTLTDWEMWIVGDACSDNTEEVVRSFGDSRVHFINLPENVGDQSGPNNEGFRRSRGRYIAYLNHDDLWFDDHLETALRELEQTGADLVWPLVVAMRSDGVFTCNDLNTERRYAPHLSIPASFWVLRRELVEAVGPWRPHWECHSTPSQDWLFRAARAGKDLRYIPRMTVIGLPSGGRPNVYARREWLENRTILQRIQTDDHFREKVLLAIAEHYSIVQSNPPVWESIRQTYRDFARRRLARYWDWPCALAYKSPLRVALRKKMRCALGSIGVHPEALELFLRYGRRGGFIRFLRRFRGLPAEPARAKRWNQ
jgi:glycosyltransferase involved in cell wall biosynthesis